MRYSGPVGIKLRGNATTEHVNIARKFLAQLHQQMKPIRMKHREWRRVLSDGTVITVLHSYGRNYINIWSPQEEGRGPSIYMDVGCYFPEIHAGLQTFPLDVYIGDDIAAHLSAGYVGQDVVFMPGHETPTTVCVSRYRYSAKNGITITSDKYISPVVTQASSAEFFNSMGGVYKSPPYRWTGKARLWAQALCGTGKLLTVDPDTTGLLISDDYRFYTATIGDSNITITPYTHDIDIWTWTELIDVATSDEDKTRLLAHVLATLTADTANTYVIGDLSALADTGDPAAYGWHWSYVDNECSIVNIVKHATLEQWVTTLARIDFTIPTAAAEAGGAKVSASVVIEETGDFRQPVHHVWWVYMGDALLQMTCAKYHAAQPTEMLEGVGVNTAVYVYYLEAGSRAVLRHTKSNAAEPRGLEDEPVPDPVCEPGYEEWSWIESGTSIIQAGGWEIENTGVDASDTMISGSGVWNESTSEHKTELRPYPGSIGSGPAVNTGCSSIPERTQTIVGYQTNYGTTQTDASVTKQFSGGIKAIVMLPRNPDGLYAVTLEGGSHGVTQRYTRHSAYSWIWKFEVQDNPPETNENPEGFNGQVWRYLMSWQLPWASWSKVTEDASSFDKRTVGISGVTFEATAEGGSELNAYLRYPIYGGDNIEAAGLSVEESYNGIARHHYATQPGFPVVHSGKIMRPAGWA